MRWALSLVFDDDVVGVDRHVLDAGPVVVHHEGVDLRVGEVRPHRLVVGELDA